MATFNLLDAGSYRPPMEVVGEGITDKIVRTFNQQAVEDGLSEILIPRDLGGVALDLEAATELLTNSDTQPPVAADQSL